MNYYIDSITGDDRNSGMEESIAWKTLKKAGQMPLKGGDRLLLKRGGRWTESLLISCSGEPDNPVSVSAYGEGTLPRIDGSGEFAVCIRDAEWVEISDLEITSCGPRDNFRNGILVVATPSCPKKILTHIQIRNMYIHDIESRSSHDAAGIMIKVCQQEDNVPVFYRDVVIEDNRLMDIGCAGIVTLSRYGNRSSHNIIDWASSGDWTPLERLRISGNYLQRVQSDGMLIIIAKGVCIEKNELRECCISAEQIHCGIWCHNSQDCLIQYNRVSNSPHGYAYGSNINCSNTQIQHNISQNNGLGFIHLCTDGAGRFNEHICICNNVSFNDQLLLFHFLGELQDIQILNNTFYTSTRYFIGVFVIQMWTNCRIDLKNNLFYCEENEIEDIYVDKCPYNINSLRFAKFSYFNNVFYHYLRVPAMKKKNVCLHDSLFHEKIKNEQELLSAVHALLPETGAQFPAEVN